MDGKYNLNGKVASVDLIENHPIFKSRVLVQDRNLGMITLYIDTPPADTPFKAGDGVRCDMASIGGSEWSARTSEISKVIPVAQGITFPPRDGEDQIYVDRVIDGDTIAFYFLVPDKGRLVGYDAPEAYGNAREEGLRAKEHLKSIFPEGSVQTVKFMGRDKYGRTLIVAPGVKDGMVDSGHGKAWDGTGGHPR